MKIIAIGDTHGRRLWKKVVEQEPDFDRLIFIGDYFDTKDAITVDVQIANFKEIIAFKLSHPERVVLLLGNHDFHYLKDAKEDYSGYNHMRHWDINEVLQPAVDSGLVQMCHVHGKFVFTHAGITKTWVLHNEIDINDLENQLNQKLLTDPRAFKFEMGDNFDYSGDDITQSPIWVRIPSLLADRLDDYIFVVGHTMVRELTMIGEIIAIDTLGTSQQYLRLENNVLNIGKIELD